jgi:GNAT superfamily N-acetyltransferase
MEVSYEPVADGELAAVVTYLEMLERPALMPDESSLFDLERWLVPTVQLYRMLFQVVGEKWLWFSRLIMPDEQLAAIIEDPLVEVYCVLADPGHEVGMLELDFREPGQCEIAFVGLIPHLSGKGHGKWLLEEALRRAWTDGISRVHVHTCTLDHPAAVTAYVRAGFTPYKRAIERFPDPRLLGILPSDCAPQVPLFGTPAVPRPES